MDPVSEKLQEMYQALIASVGPDQARGFFTPAGLKGWGHSTFSNTNSYLSHFRKRLPCELLQRAKEFPRPILRHRHAQTAH